MKKRLSSVEKALEEIAPTPIGRFAMTPAPQGAVMLDTKTGESWILRGAKGGADDVVWVPIKGREPLPQPTPVPGGK